MVSATNKFRIVRTMHHNPTSRGSSSELERPDLYINRELSWVDFNWRVFEEARDPRHPLLERVKFVSIFDTNLDEFIMIRLAGLKDQVACYTISLDLPFAQKRFCTSENITNMQTLSDTHNHSFGKAYGVLIEGLPLPLLALSVFVVGKDGKVTYAEYVKEVTSEPNYDKALAALKAAAG